MKKLLVVAIAVFMMAGTSAAAEFNTGVVADNAAATVQQQNVVEKMIALIKNYTKKINATKSIEELQAVAVEFAEVAQKFEEINAKEAAKFEETATEAQKAKYEKELNAALKAMEQATMNKVKEFAY